MDFRLLMLSAMYENGGNTTHRFLDGHPQMFVYPFESQIGTKLVNDHLTSLFPVKYRWPVFDLEATPYQDYKAIIDEECKVRARTPKVSKFRHMDFEFDDDNRCGLYEQYVCGTGRSRANNVKAFFQATFDAWKNYRRSGKEEMYVGYSPIIIVDGEKILEDLPGSHVLHVVRNPWSAYADTKKRPVPLPLKTYVTLWCINQYFALLTKDLYPDRVHIVRLEDTITDPVSVLGRVCEKIGLQANKSLGSTTWNTKELERVYPWGTIREPTPEKNQATAIELSKEERDAIRIYAQPYLKLLDYDGFI